MRSPSWIDRALVGLLLLWAFFSFASPIDTKSNDFWWHLSLGRTMVQDHMIPNVELWSHTMLGKPFLNFEWLFEVALYVGWSVLKIPGLILMKGVFLVAQVGLLVWLLRRRGASVLLAVALAAVWVYFLRYRDYFRPEMVTQTGIVVTLLWSDELVRQAASNAAKKGWWFLATAAFFCLWANTHGGFLLGLAILGLRAVGAWFEGENSRRTVVPLLLQHIAAALLGCLANPYGWKMLAFPFEHMAMLEPHRGMPWEVSEWKRPAWAGYKPFWIWALGVSALAVTSQIRKRRWDVEGLLLLLVFGFSAVRYIRNIHPFILISLPLVVRHGKEFWDQTLRVSWVKQAATAVLLFVLAQQAWSARTQTFGLAVIPSDYPVTASRFLRETGLNGPLYNSYSWGGYVGWILGRRLPVFMDSRFLFVDLLKEDYEARKSPEAWTAYLNRYGIQTALLPYPKGFVAASRRRLARNPQLVFQSEWTRFFPQKEWALVFWDNTALVMARRIGPNAQKAKTMDYPFFRPDDYLEIDRQIREGTLKRADVLRDIDRNTSEAGMHPAARFFHKFFTDPAGVLETDDTASAPASPQP